MLADPVKAAGFTRFCKTGPGEYAQGDKFFGISVPDLRKLAKQHCDLSLIQNQRLLQSPWHESRFLALLILVEQFQAASKQQNTAVQKAIYEYYLLDAAGNWQT